MPNERIQEALSHLRDEWPLRVLLSALADRVAELAALLGRAEAQNLPPEFLTRIRAIEEEMGELSRLRQRPPLPKKGKQEGRCTTFPCFKGHPIPRHPGKLWPRRRGRSGKPGRWPEAHQKRNLPRGSAGSCYLAGQVL